MKTLNKSALALIGICTVGTIVHARGFGAASGAHRAPAAVNPPFRRECLVAGGQPWNINLGTDQVELCRFGKGGVSSIELMLYLEQGTPAQSIQAFLAGPQSCDAAGGETDDTTDLDGNAVEVCKFSDGSLIETDVLSAGPDSSEGQGLANALSHAAN
jgi:putative hemolysin